VHGVGGLHIVEEAVSWERKFMLFKVYLRQSVGVSSRPKTIEPLKVKTCPNFVSVCQDVSYGLFS